MWSLSSKNSGSETDKSKDRKYVIGIVIESMRRHFMYHNIIKDAVALDKEARDKLKELQKKKEGLEDVIKAKQEELETAMKAEVKRSYDAQKKQYEDEINERKETALRQYEETLKELAEQYYEHKFEWIDHVFKAIIE